jgi:hypothetical protein
MKKAIAWIHERRERTNAGAPIDIGVNTEPIYVGEAPFEIEPFCATGSAEAIAARLLRYRAIGVDHMQIRFRSRSASELVDQIDAFGRDVAPFLQD